MYAIEIDAPRGGRAYVVSRWVTTQDGRYAMRRKDARALHGELRKYADKNPKVVEVGA